MTSRAKAKRRKLDRQGGSPNGQRIAAIALDGWDDLDDLRTFADLDDNDPGGPPPFLLAMAREDLDAACAKAAWSRRPASAAPQSGSPGPGTRTDPPRSSPQLDTRKEPPRSSPPIARNAPPTTVWEALRRLLACNRQQLAARLGVSRHTLQRWERGELTEAGAARVAALMQETLATAGAGWTVAPVFSQAALERGKPHQPPG